MRPPPFPKGNVFAFLDPVSLPVDVVPALFQASISYYDSLWLMHDAHDAYQVIWKQNNFKSDLKGFQSIVPRVFKVFCGNHILHYDNISF